MLNALVLRIKVEFFDVVLGPIGDVVKGCIVEEDFVERRVGLVVSF